MTDHQTHDEWAEYLGVEHTVICLDPPYSIVTNAYPDVNADNSANEDPAKD